MNVLDKVTVRKEANIYYDGRVSSRELLEEDGSRKTLGLVVAGEYEFSTDGKEVLEILSGEGCIIYNENEHPYMEGDIFSIPPKTNFIFKANKVTDYYCSYIED